MIDLEKQEPLVKVLARFKRSEDWVQPFFDQARECYRLYRSYQKSSEKLYKHSIFVPYSFAFTEDAIATFMLSIFTTPTVYSIRPRYQTISPELAKELEVILDFLVTDDEAEFALELEEAARNIMMYSVGYLIDFPLTSGGENSELIGMKFTAPKFFSMYPEPLKKRMSRTSWMIRRSWDFVDNLKKLEAQGVYGNVEKLSGGELPDDETLRLLQEVDLSSSDILNAEDSKRGIVEILDYMEDRNIITIAGRKTVIRDTTKNPVRPYLFKYPVLDGRLSGAPDEFFGVSLIESIKPLQKDLNAIRSQRRDNVSLILNKLFTLDLAAGEVDLDTVFSAPGNIIVQTGKALDELPVTDVTSSSYRETDELKYDMENATSMWQYSRGGTPQRRETATTVIRLQQAAQGRAEWGLKKLDFYILQPAAKRMLTYAREYMSKNMYTDIIGRDNHWEEFRAIEVDKMARSFSVVSATESIRSIKELDMNQFMQAFDRMIRVPGINQIALMKILLFKLGQYDLKEVLPMASPQGQETMNALADKMRAATGGAVPTPGQPVPGMPPGPPPATLPGPKPAGL